MKRRVLAWILAAAMTATSVPSNAFTAFAGEAADEAATEVTAAVDAGGSAEEAAADAGGSRELAGANGGESADDTAYEEEAPDQIDLVDALSGEAADEDSDIVLEDETPDGTITDLDQQSSADADDGILIEEADEELPTASEAERNLADSNNTYATVDLNLPDQTRVLTADVDDKTSVLEGITADVTFAGDSAPNPQTVSYVSSYIHASNADYLYWYAVTGFDSTGNPENLTDDGTLTSGTWYLVPVKKVYDNDYNLTTYQFFPKKGEEDKFVPSLDSVANVPVTVISQEKAAEGRELTTGAPLTITGDRNKYAGMKFVPHNTSLYQFSFDTSIYEVKLFSASEDGGENTEINVGSPNYRPDEKLQAGKTYYLFVRTYN